MKKIKNITIKEIAQKAGVSHTTVSRALNDQGTIAPETVARIKQIAQDLHYVPSNLARGLKTNRSRMLGVIVHRIADPFYSEILAGIQNIAHQFQYTVFVSAFESDEERVSGLIRGIVGRQFDALIIGDSFFTSERFNELGIHVPSVFIHNRASEVLPHSIYHDDVAAMRSMTRHLLDLGHHRIAFGGNARGGLLHKYRRQGVVEELQSVGLDLPEMYDLIAPDGQMRSGVILAEKLLALSELPTAMVCYNDMQALGVMQTLQQANLHIPADISVTGFDDIPLAGFLYPSLTTYHQPILELGQIAAKVALHLLGENVADSIADEPTIILHGELKIRQSTATPSSHLLTVQKI